MVLREQKMKEIQIGRELLGSKQALRSAYLSTMVAGLSTQTSIEGYKTSKFRCSFFCGCQKLEEEEDMEALEVDEKFFNCNGAILLEMQTALHQGKGSKSEPIKIFSAREIRQATDNFDHDLMVGRVISTVYRGTIDDWTVAVKTGRGLPPCQGVIHNYLNQVAIKQLIHHNHVIKLHGCCLETQLPILVTEYMSNCNLFYHLHGKGKADPRRSSGISWRDLLRIAMEISNAISYIHYALPKPIVHLQVISSSIYFDESFTSKLSNFGFSLSIPLREDFISQTVLGTPGYIDPEYQRTHRVTKKCDVYSFGVLLVEILTGKDPIEMFNSSTDLADQFVSSIKQNNGLEFIHSGVTAEASGAEIEAVVAIALRCLRDKGEERPTMREVASELRRIRRLSVTERNNVAGLTPAP